MKPTNGYIVYGVNIPMMNTMPHATGKKRFFTTTLYYKYSLPEAMNIITGPENTKHGSVIRKVHKKLMKRH